jgi:hypothetical protein
MKGQAMIHKMLWVAARLSHKGGRKVRTSKTVGFFRFPAGSRPDFARCVQDFQNRDRFGGRGTLCPTVDA